MSSFITQGGQNIAFKTDYPRVEKVAPSDESISDESVGVGVKSGPHSFGGATQDTSLGKELSQGLSQETSAEDRQARTSVALPEAVNAVSDFLQAKNRDLTFSIDEETERSIVKVVDSQSGKLIRQIPSEEVLALAERIKSLHDDIGSRVGVLINNEV
ncbi:flagellar protein FlaG [Salinimonas chungwhensis]|uniref:flagellar protein FlaG n=1 Tax=Salinimonas chungwhensis TaxID=265425 RepID=UPI000372EF9C|nr:flagellar protein FlaG [Salinimonas chungwhensis]